jgi:hypothetical protein
LVISVLTRPAAIRLSVIVLVAVPVLVAWQTNVPDKLPAAALGSAFLLRIEHGFGAFLVLLFGLVVLVNALWDGELPTKIGREGAEYSTRTAADQAEKATENLAKLSNRRWEILRGIIPSHQQRLDDLEARVKELEKA